MPEPSIHGVRVLVVEDNSTLAMSLCARLQDLGADVVGPFPSLRHATPAAASGKIDIGVLDINLDGETTYSLARSLRDRGVAIIFMTGYDSVSVPADLRDLSVLGKLESIETLARRIAELLGDRGAA